MDENIKNMHLGWYAFLFVTFYVAVVCKTADNPQSGCRSSPIECKDLIQNSWNWENAYTVPKNCTLGIISAGIPRSGSTLTTNMLDYIVKQIFPPPKYQHYSTYWNYHFHMEHQMNASEKQATLQVHEMAMGQVQENHIIIAKSHEAQAPLLELCKNTILVTTTRSLCDTVPSAVQAKWFGYEGGWASDFMTQSIAQHECWICQAKNRKNVQIMQTKYSEIVQKPAKMLAQFLSAVSELDIPLQTLKEFSFPQILGQEANPWIPGSKHNRTGTVVFPAGFEVPEYVMRWQRKENYNNDCFRSHHTPRTRIHTRKNH
eukprot:TRINITY_DN3777_c0_g1_i1.p1 TRINITY_DN3777_c0_g1~~TRINITY_DN3777_c0_g1_i1.p1  ORF type:complete len:316 (-),score=42.52 TRINITY_DN3777_c0_g1_i1:225-1172(-)